MRQPSRPMGTILTISKREITRLRSRFTGRTRLFVIGFFAVAVILSLVIYHQDPIISKGLYNIGVSPDGPVVSDARFHVVPAEPAIGYRLLSEGDIDVYVRGDQVITRNDDRSQYAASALKQYLEKQELLRISDEYDIDHAFPLRVQIHHLEKDGNLPDGVGEPVVALKLLEPETPSDNPSIPSDPESPSVSQAPAQETMPPDVPSLSDPSIAQHHEDVAPELLAPTEEPLVDEQLEQKQSDDSTDEAVREQLNDFRNDNGIPEFKAEFASEDEIIIPSLLKPPIPLSQVILAFFYVVPLFLVSVFFTSSFMEEKTNRKLVILMSAPVTPFQIIIGKMLPYLGYALVTIVGITLMLGGNVLLGLAIFLPIALFIFSIYLMVALLYRTFKDQTFFSMMAVWIVTAYLVAPAMFTGVNDISYVSPLTLAVLMYRGESFGLSEYFFSTIPMYLIFFVTMLVAVRIFNEEYLMAFRPLYRKLSEAVDMIMSKSHLSFSVFTMSLLLIPVAFMIQFGSIVIAFNLSTGVALGVIFVLAIITEEIAKSTAIVVLMHNGVVNSIRSVIKYAFISALGFLIGEKLLLFLALSVMSESTFVEEVFSAGVLPIFPLTMHFVTTSVVCLITTRLGIKFYPVGIFAGSVLHALYNLYVIFIVGAGS